MELNLWNELSNNMNTLKNEFDFLSTSKTSGVKQSAPETSKKDSKAFRQKRINNLFTEILKGIGGLQRIKREESEQLAAEKSLTKVFRDLKRRFKKNALKLSSVQEDLEDTRDCYLMTNVY